MKKHKYLFNIITVILIANHIAYSQESDDLSEGAYNLFYVQQILKNVDNNNNNRFEKDENVRTFGRFKYLDTNNDEVITLEEFKNIKINYLNTNAKRMLNVVYKKTDNRDLYLDIYYPTNTTDYANLPTIIYTHGGGWVTGDKQLNGLFTRVVSGLLENGFCVVSVDYRLWSGNGKTVMRDCVIDSKDAVRYMSKYSKELGVNPNKFYAFGDSAGGQIAQILLLSTPESLEGDADLRSSQYKMIAGVSWYGPVDFENADLFNYDNRPNFRDRFGPRILKPDSRPSDKTALYKEMSPINYLTKDSPNLLMIQGDGDTTIPVKHAYVMEKKAKKMEAPLEVIIVKGAGHNWREAKPGVSIEPTTSFIAEKTVNFFVAHQ